MPLSERHRKGMVNMKTEDLKLNYYALLISICLNKTPSRALTLMGLTDGSGTSGKKN